MINIIFCIYPDYLNTFKLFKCFAKLHIFLRNGCTDHGRIKVIGLF